MCPELQSNTDPEAGNPEIKVSCGFPGPVEGRQNGKHSCKRSQERYGHHREEQKYDDRLQYGNDMKHGIAHTYAQASAVLIAGRIPRTDRPAAVHPLR